MTVRLGVIGSCVLVFYPKTLRQILGQDANTQLPIIPKQMIIWRNSMTYSQMLVKMTTLQRQTQWDNYLPDALLMHHAHPGSSTGVSLFFLMYGKELRLPTKRIQEIIQKGPTDREVGLLPKRRLAPSGSGPVLGGGRRARRSKNGKSSAAMMRRLSRGRLGPWRSCTKAT